MTTGSFNHAGCHWPPRDQIFVILQTPRQESQTSHGCGLEARSGEPERVRARGNTDQPNHCGPRERVSRKAESPGMATIGAFDAGWQADRIAARVSAACRLFLAWKLAAQYPAELPAGYKGGCCAGGRDARKRASLPDSALINCSWTFGKRRLGLFEIEVLNQ